MSVEVKDLRLPDAASSLELGRAGCRAHCKVNEAFMLFVIFDVQGGFLRE